MNTKKIETNENIINRYFVSNVDDIKSMATRLIFGMTVENLMPFALRNGRVGI